MKIRHCFGRLAAGVLVMVAVSTALPVLAQKEVPVRKQIVMNDGWLFSQDGEQWQEVQVPHDWAIAGPFDKKWDLQTVAIKENGETKATEKSGRSGALPWIGQGFYKTTFSVPAPYTKALLVFDGAMSEPKVYVNGQYAGGWAYGYNTFRVDATPFVFKDGRENQLEVRLSNIEESSRWYPGAGIYRPVTLQLLNDVSLDDWGTFVRTTRLTSEEALIDVDTQVLGGQEHEGLAVEVSILNPKGYVEIASHADVDAEGHTHTQLSLKHPACWTPESPSLYKVRVCLYQNNQLVDQQELKTGVRTVSVSKENGFQLNGRSRKLKGVCLHHDLGPLGAAVNKAALVRQIKLMKEMGADAIRTSHNMPSQMQMDVCDSLGMMVMAESFDMWIYAKCKNGYARFFKEWGDKDIERLVVAHRNHPSIVMWSIGNEIPEQWSEEGRQIAARLQDVCHRFDPTRPVTQGMDKAENALKSGFAQVMDVPGFNYRVHKYPKNIQQLPKGFLLGSETASTVSSRGVYKFPVEVSNRKVYADGQCSSYDTEYCSWSNLPEADFAAMDDLSYTIGQFVWTGFDYLGEPTPYDEYWPSRSSYFGICDLAGLPKDRYYLYRGEWRDDVPTIHLLPHWAFGKKQVGKVTPVYCYTNYPSAELFVNGKSQGRITKRNDLPKEQFDNGGAAYLDRYRLRWNDVKYEPGELKVVVYDKDGRQAGEQMVRTAGKPSQLVLEPDKTVLSADGDDLLFVTVSLADQEGNFCPNEDCQLTFSVEGAARFQAVCNGDVTSLEPFTQPQMRLFSGKLVVLVRAEKQGGEATLVVKDAQHNLEKRMSFSVK